MHRGLLLSVALWLAWGVCQASPDVVSFSFQWAEAKFGTKVLPKAAMLVPIDHARPLGPSVQFDTGSDETYVYAWAAEALAKSGALMRQSARGEAQATSSASLRMQGSLASFTTPSRIIEHGGTGGPVGTLGAGTASASLLLIDYVRRDIFIVRGARYGRAASCLFDPESKAIALRSIGVRSGVNVTVGGATLGPVLFDTGSSAFGLVLFSRERWNQLPGAMHRDGQSAVTVPGTFIGDVSISSKPVAGSVCVGQACRTNAEVGVVGIEAVPGFVGTLGNREFTSGFAVLDSIKHRAVFSRDPLVGRSMDCFREAIRKQ